MATQQNTASNDEAMARILATISPDIVVYDIQMKRHTVLNIDKFINELANDDVNEMTNDPRCCP